MTRTLDLGRVRLNALAGEVDPESVQVASGWGPDGESVILLRLGVVVVVMSRDGAYALGDALQAEVDLSRRQDTRPS